MKPGFGNIQSTFIGGWTPLKLGATVVSDAAINLTWTGGKLAKVERSIDGISYTQIGTGTDSYSDTGLTTGTKYWYRVKGSIYSSVVNSTTFGVAYGVTDTFADGRYNTIVSLAQNPLNQDKVIKTYLSKVASGYGDTDSIAMQISNDKGQTFGVVSTAYSPGINIGAQEQHSGYSSDGRLHILCTTLSNTGVCGLIYLYSDNDGVSFTISDISALVADGTLPFYRNSGSLIENNGVLMSCFYRTNSGNTSSEKCLLRLVAGTWEFVSIDITSEYENESSIVSLGGNNLLMLSKNTTRGKFVQYSSSDNGVTWTRLGDIPIVLTAFGTLPNYLKKFKMNGEDIIVLYTTYPSYKISAHYGRAIDLLKLGLGGWNLNSLKYLIDVTANYYVWHGDVLHYDNNYNAIGCFPKIRTDLASADLITFNADTTDFAAQKALLFPELALGLYTSDADADAHNTAAGITSPTIVAATRNLMGRLKGNSLSAKVKAFYIMAGGSAAANKFNFMNPADSDAAFRLDFNGTWIHSATGAKPNGTDAYADTHLAPSTVLTLYSAGLGYYSRTDVQEAAVDMGAVHNDNPTNTYPCLMLRIRYNATTGRFYCYNGYMTTDAALSATRVDSLGLTFGSRTANNVNKIYIGGIQSGATVTATALNSTTSRTIFIGANNTDDVAGSFTTKECAGAIITDGLNDAESLLLSKIITAFNRELGRHVKL